MTAPEKTNPEDSGALYPLYNISEDIVWLPDMKEPDFLLDPEIRPRVTGGELWNYFWNRRLLTMRSGRS